MKQTPKDFFARNISRYGAFIIGRPDGFLITKENFDEFYKLSKEHFELELIENKVSELRKEVEKEKTKTFNHAEAFCLMEYVCKACFESEILWNSRDGVTPFIIKCKTCDGEAAHTAWAKDFRSPNHKPEPGERFFIDITMEKYREYQLKKIERYWNHETIPMSERFKNKGEALNSLCEGFDSGQPDIKIMS